MAAETPTAEVAARPADIRQRTYEFARRVVRLVRALPHDVATQVMSRQLARSGTGVGANVEEAQGAHSRIEFARRMGIARTEARETLPHAAFDAISRESEEILRILVKIVKTTRSA